jgi:hypothetical protein
MNFDNTRRLRRTRLKAQNVAYLIKSMGFPTSDLNNAIASMQNEELQSMKDEIRQMSPDDILNNAAYICRLTR